VSANFKRLMAVTTGVEHGLRDAGIEDFDQWMEATSKKLPQPREASPLARAAWELFDLWKDHFYMERVTNLKLLEIGRGIEAADATKNATVKICLARAFLEHSASYSYQAHLLARALDDLPKQKDSANKLFDTLHKHHQLLRRLYYGSTGHDASGFVHVEKMIDRMEKHIPDLKAKYEMLCDFVHPNYGSNRLVSGGMLGQGALQPSNEMLKDEIRRSEDVVDECAAHVLERVTESGRCLAELQGWFSSASAAGAKLGNIFGLRDAAEGVGTESDPIWFPKARSPIEEIKAFGEYLSKRDIVMRARSVARIEGGFIYDKVESDIGTLWFKFTMTT